MKVRNDAAPFRRRMKAETAPVVWENKRFLSVPGARRMTHGKSPNNRYATTCPTNARGILVKNRVDLFWPNFRIPQIAAAVLLYIYNAQFSRTLPVP